MCYLAMESLVLLRTLLLQDAIGICYFVENNRDIDI